MGAVININKYKMAKDGYVDRKWWAFLKGIFNGETIEIPIWGIVILWILLVGGWIAFFVTHRPPADVTIHYQYEYQDGKQVEGGHWYYKP